MDYGSFSDDILKPLEARVPDFDPGRVWTAYTDATNMVDVIARLERDVGSRDADQLNAAGTDAAAKEATEVFFLDNYIGTLHKALIEFANIFMVSTLALFVTRRRLPVIEITPGATSAPGGTPN